MSKPISRLSSSKIPKKEVTYQSKLTDADIEEKLKLYKKIDSLEELTKLPLGTHFRYFSVTKDPSGKKIKQFRLGGFLNNKDNYDKYIILTNKNVSWSVNTQTCILYRKLKDEEIDKNINQQTELANNADNELNKIKDKYSKLEKAYYELTDKYTRLKEKYEKTKTNTIR
jgi:predicted nuclease with TOPRIM domain